MMPLIREGSQHGGYLGMREDGQHLRLWEDQNARTEGNGKTAKLTAVGDSKRDTLWQAAGNSGKAIPIPFDGVRVAPC